MSNPIVFLDIDGVLNTPATFPRLDSKAVNNFNSLIARTQARIVISSSWRYSIANKSMSTRGFEILLWSHGVVIPKGSVISWTKSDEEIASREDQIKEWLSRNAFVGEWVVLDDLTLNLPKGNFVKTNPDIGFSGANCLEAIRFLTGE